MVYVAARWPALVKEAVLLGVRTRGGRRRDHGRALPVPPGLGPGEPRGERRRAGPGRAAARREAPAAHRRGRPGAGGPGAPGPGPADAGGPHAPGAGQPGRDPQARRLGRGPAAARSGRRGRLPGPAATTTSRPSRTTGVLENAAISQEENPAPGVVWYADGQLHLDHTVLAVEGLKDMTRIGNGVVYGDEEGRVVYAADDGSREVLGHKDPEVPVAATDETGWAAWVETGGDQPRLVVKEAATGNDVSSTVGGRRRAGGRRGRRRRLLRRRRGRARAGPGRGPAVRPVAPADLLDVRSRIRAFQVDEDTIERRPVLLRRRVPGPGGGRRALPRRQPRGHPPAGLGRRSRSTTPAPASELPNGVPDGDHVVTFAPGSRVTVTYVVAPAGQSPGHELELRTCELDHDRGVHGRRPDPQPGRYAGAGTLRAWETRTSSARSTSSAPARSPATRWRSSTTPTTSTTRGCSCSRSGPTCPRRRSCCARPPTRPTTGCGSSPPAGSCRSPATRRWAARTRGSKQGVRRAASTSCRSARAGLVTIERGERLAFAGAAAAAGRPGRATRTSTTSPGRCGSRRDDIVDSKWCDNGPGWVGVLLRDAQAVLDLRPDPTHVRRLGHRRRRPLDRRRPASGDADVEVRAFDMTVEDPVTGSLNASLGQWLAGTRLPEQYVAAQGTAIGRRRPGAREAGGEHGVGGRRHRHDAPWGGHDLVGARR